ncbi:MAG: SDR family NAD(P)-dependent oxidoreductase [Mogibacterium sp.]|jgi:short-subunit dehydrogenase|nr:SDR family NAD(P)-dependent oxidoreductase [Mogibacterium sp.]MBR3330314.1 SDR family NAD(P)-dependent oxidoreductase [Mogibacterium sp.]
MKKNIYGKNVFVTGASSGIGKACALMFAKNGCNVTGVSRNTEEKTEHFAGGGKLTLRKLDVTDENATREFIEKLPQVDIAVLCAGMGVAGPAETAPSELTRKQMEVNYFGTLNAAQPCLSGMRARGNGLLIIIGSIAGRVSIPMQSQYSASKYALEAFTDAVRMEMKQYGVKACIIEPGDTKTGFTAARETQEISGSAAGSGYGNVLEKSVAKMASDEQNGRSPDSVAKVALALAARKNPPARVPVGLDYKALMMLLRVMPDRCKEFILSKLYLPK